MKQIVAALMTEPKLLSEFDPEWIEDGTDKVIVTAMKGLYAVGVTPTPQVIDREASILGITGMLQAIEARMEMAGEFVPKYVVDAMREKHNDNLQVQMAMNVLKMKKEGKRSDSVDDYVRSMLKKTTSSTRSIDMRTAVDDTLEELRRMYSGETLAYFKTGHHNLDRKLSWFSRMIVMVAAAQKQGKTLWTMDECQRMLMHNPELRLDYYNFEQKATQMVASQIAYQTKIDSRVVTAKDGIPSEEQQQLIFRAKATLDTMPIKFFNQKMTMSELRRSITSRADRNTIVVIDNLGLIQPEKGMTDNQHDDYVARELVDIRDANDPLIITLHHLGKESETHWNQKSGFEPHQHNIRGSNRWGDYLNALVMLHRPEMYERLRAEIGPEEWQKLQGYMLVKCPLIRDSKPQRWHWRHQLHIGHFEEMPESGAPELMKE